MAEPGSAQHIFNKITTITITTTTTTTIILKY
jgi:hypothetical protein